MVNSSPLTLYVHVIALSERVSNFAIRHELEIAFDPAGPLVTRDLRHDSGDSITCRLLVLPHLVSNCPATESHNRVMPLAAR